MQHFRNYTRGLLTDLERKTAEPLAPYAGTPPHCLQQVLKACLWDHEGLTEEGVQQRPIRNHTSPSCRPIRWARLAFIDETRAAPRKDPGTPGVQPPYLGCCGQGSQNGLVTAHLGRSFGPFKALLDSEMSLRRVVGCLDRERCREADIPDEVHYRSKWEIGLELLARTERNGWQFDWLTFEEWYGGKRKFPACAGGGGRAARGKCPSRSRVGRDDAGPP